MASYLAKAIAAVDPAIWLRNTGVMERYPKIVSFPEYYRIVLGIQRLGARYWI